MKERVGDRHRFEAGQYLDTCIHCGGKPKHPFHFSDVEVKAFDVNQERLGRQFFAGLGRDASETKTPNAVIPVNVSATLIDLRGLINRLKEGTWHTWQYDATTCENAITLIENFVAREKVRSMQAEGPRPGTDTSSFSAGADHKCCVRNCQSKKTTACSRYCAPQKRDMLTYLCSQHEFDSTAFIETWIEKCANVKCLRPVMAPGLCGVCFTELNPIPISLPQPYRPGDTFTVDPGTSGVSAVVETQSGQRPGLPRYQTYDRKTGEVIQSHVPPSDLSGFTDSEAVVLKYIDVVWAGKDEKISALQQDIKTLEADQKALLDARDILRARQKK